LETDGGNILDSLRDFDLEEIVIVYLKIQENYYILSNLIVKR